MLEEKNSINKNVTFAMKRLQEIVMLPDHSKGLWISRDCILVETYTGKTYTYRMFNYLNGEEQYLGNKKTAVDDEYYKSIMEKVKDLSFYNTEIPNEGLALIEHIFCKIFTSYGYVIRTEQVELSKKMYQSLKSREILISDVPVGLGKTHAYLVAAVVYHLTERRNVSA